MGGPSAAPRRAVSPKWPQAHAKLQSLPLFASLGAAPPSRAMPPLGGKWRRVPLTETVIEKPSESIPSADTISCPPVAPHLSILSPPLCPVLFSPHQPGLTCGAAANGGRGGVVRMRRCVQRFESRPLSCERWDSAHIRNCSKLRAGRQAKSLLWSDYR